MRNEAFVADLAFEGQPGISVPSPFSFSARLSRVSQCRSFENGAKQFFGLATDDSKMTP